MLIVLILDLQPADANAQTNHRTLRSSTHDTENTLNVVERRLTGAR